ncbi:MAG: ParB N-terminal domain-containing protein, partial [Candidatus Riflebacteria bacterium]|nr:ParB N-terminal domain-containing protein [Candidatus Riflebacteria bacterium]
KKDFLVKLVTLNQASLKFYTENPRVYSILNLAGEEPGQDEIEELMCDLEHVKELKDSIESNGGLIDPLIVRDGDYTVLEGNSRLAAYRILAKKDPLKWGKVKCKLLPADISDDAIFTLLGQYHIIGRKDWEPFEQAHYLWRRQREVKTPVEYMAKELGIGKKKAENMIAVIEFMITHDDLNKRRWSYYEEYLKNASIKKYRETSPDLDETLVKAIKKGEIKEASDIRKLGDIAKIGDKQSKKVIQKISSGELTLYEGYENVLESGKLDDVVKRLQTFRKLIYEESFEKQLAVSELKQSKFEIKRIIKKLEEIQEKLG